jgi:hypothetical protein
VREQGDSLALQRSSKRGIGEQPVDAEQGHATKA